MKKLALAIAIIVSLTSCQKDDVKTKTEPGLLHIDIGLSISVNEVNSLLKSVPQVEDLKVIIYLSDGTEVMAFDRVSDLPETIELETGDYFIEAYSDNNRPAEFVNPYYYGVSGIFTIGSNTQQSVLVNCTLANTIVSVLYSASIVSSFEDFTTTVSSAQGSLVFTKDEIRLGYFQPLPLDILVELTYQKLDGTQIIKTLSGTIPAPLANRHYEIQVDASIDEGMATFQVLLDDTEVLVEVVEISDDSGQQQPGAIGYGELLITEIMNNPAALSDTEGEWFEIYNNSDHEINLQNLILERDETNKHTISDEVVLSPGAYFVFSRNDLATDASNEYIYGSDITLSNTGAVLSIYNEGPESDPGSLIFSVDYGAVDFPNPTGSAISLSPAMLNSTDAVLGASWCQATSIYNTGDLGTPGLLNNECVE